MYQVEFRPRAAQELENLETSIADRILKKLHWIAENFESIRPEALTGPLSGFYKLRVGDYRVIYRSNREKQVLTVHLVGHRREIYKLPE